MQRGSQHQSEITISKQYILSTLSWTLNVSEQLAKQKNTLNIQIHVPSFLYTWVSVWNHRFMDKCVCFKKKSWHVRCVYVLTINFSYLIPFTCQIYNLNIFAKQIHVDHGRSLIWWLITSCARLLPVSIVPSFEGCRIHPPFLCRREEVSCPVLGWQHCFFKMPVHYQHRTGKWVTVKITRLMTA